MHHLEFEPPAPLQDAIKCFWYHKAYYPEVDTEFEVVPDGYAEIIFYFGSTCSILQDAAALPLPSPFIMGLLNRPAHFITKGRFEIIGVRCYPWMVFDLLRLPSGKNGVQTFEHAITKLQPALQQCVESGKTDDAIELLRNYFLQEHPQLNTDNVLLKAGTALNTTNGSIAVNKVAAAAHATVRTLERKFKQSSGHTVKDVSALMRFEQVRNNLWLDPTVNLAGIAQELGYTDQSHLSREFKRFSNTTPAAFARKAKKDKLNIDADFVAFVQS